MTLPSVPAGAPAPSEPEQLAQRFHEAYERLAPNFWYETRRESAKPWAEVPEPNRRLMIAVCAEILGAVDGVLPRAAPSVYEVDEVLLDVGTALVQLELAGHENPTRSELSAIAAARTSLAHAQTALRSRGAAPEAGERAPRLRDETLAAIEAAIIETTGDGESAAYVVRYLQRGGGEGRRA